MGEEVGKGLEFDALHGKSMMPGQAQGVSHSRVETNQNTWRFAMTSIAAWLRFVASRMRFATPVSHSMSRGSWTNLGRPSVFGRKNLK